VKVRGFRIELGEVEAALRKQRGVREAAVVVREEAAGDQRIVAYVVPAQEGVAGVGELQSALRESLPEYMVPSTCVLLDALPLTPSGKLDRRRLPAPGRLRPTLGQEYAAPRTEVERQIAAIWREVLRVEAVGVYDNFFDVGGHSLLLTQVHQRLQERLGADLSVVEMFNHPTVHALAARLAQGEGEAPKSDERRAEETRERLSEGKSRLRQQLRQRTAAERAEAVGVEVTQ
jgi:aryl carrier-like protein